MTDEEAAEALAKAILLWAPQRLTKLVEALSPDDARQIARELIPDPELTGKWADFAAIGAERAVAILESDLDHDHQWRALQALWAYVAMGLRGAYHKRRVELQQEELW